jgi:hypothetical protein
LGLAARSNYRYGSATANHIPYCLSRDNVVTVGFGGKAKPQVLLCQPIIVHVVCHVSTVVTVGFGGTAKPQVLLSYGQSFSLLSVT